MSDSITNELIAEHLARAEKGERKYGVTLDRDDLGMSAWLQHLCEELMDGSLYAKKAKQVYAAELKKDWSEQIKQAVGRKR